MWYSVPYLGPIPGGESPVQANPTGLGLKAKYRAGQSCIGPDYFKWAGL